MENKLYRFLVHSLGYFSREWRMFRETVQLVTHLAGTDGTYLNRANIPPHKYDKIGRKRFFAVFTFFHRCMSSGWRVDYTPFGSAIRLPLPQQKLPLQDLVRENLVFGTMVNGKNTCSTSPIAVSFKAKSGHKIFVHSTS